MSTRSLTVLLALVVMAWFTTAVAEDVKVIVIEPDKPATTGQTSGASGQQQPAPATESGQAVELMRTNDRTMTGMLRGLNLTAAETTKVNTLIKGFEDAREAERAKVRQNVEALTTKLRGLEDQRGEEAQALRDQIRDAYRGGYSGYRDERDKLLDSIGEALGPDKAAKLKEIRENWNTPAAEAQRNARGITSRMFEGVDLTEEQSQKINQAIASRMQKMAEQQEKTADQRAELMTKLREAREKNDEEAQQALRDELRKLMPDFRQEMQAAREEINQFLTAEQRAKLETQRQERTNEMNERIISSTTRPLENLKLTDDQKQQVGNLSKAARDALGQTDDWNARRELVDKLRQDIAQVLNEEQRKSYESANTRGGFGGFGGRGGQGFRGNRDGQRDGGRRGGNRGGQTSDSNT